jgi:hypothetical protein
MGWASGSALVCKVAETVVKHVPEEARRELYEALVDACDDMDWDTHDEAMGIDPVLDAVLVDRHPCLGEDEDDWTDEEEEE